jgi:hypothetical protein
MSHAVSLLCSLFRSYAVPRIELFGHADAGQSKSLGTSPFRLFHVATLTG